MSIFSLSKAPSEEDRNLSAADREFLTRIAQKICNSGFVTPAVFFLEMGKPLSLLGSHAMVFFGPIVNAFIQTDGYYRAAELFEEADNVEFLLSEIERIDREEQEETKGESSER